MTNFTLADVALKAAALLNDAAQTLFTFDVLLPFMEKSYEEMVLTLDSRQVQVEYAATSSPILVLAATTPSILSLPNDFLYPLKLEERLRNSDPTIPYDPMEERDFELNITKIDHLRFWSWRGDVIHFPGTTTDREVLLYYVKLFDTPTDNTTPITIQRVNLYMETRTAALAAMVVLQDEERAIALDTDAAKWLDMIVRVMVRTKQGLYARRKPFGKRWTSPKRIIIS